MFLANIMNAGVPPSTMGLKEGNTDGYANENSWRLVADLIEDRASLSDIDELIFLKCLSSPHNTWMVN